MSKGLITNLVMVTRIADLGLICDYTNPISQRKPQPSTSSGAGLFEGPEITY